MPAAGVETGNGEAENRVASPLCLLHALMSLLTPNYPAVDKITIIPRGEALGYVSSIMEEKFLYSTSKQDLLNRIDVAMAGRVAEEVMLG